MDLVYEVLTNDGLSRQAAAQPIELPDSITLGEEMGK
jgi:hypothetical protein